MSKIDARGLSCPEPVILIRKAMMSKENAYDMIVDNVASKENVTRYAEHQGWKIQVLDANESEAGGFSLISFMVTFIGFTIFDVIHMTNGFGVPSWLLASWSLSFNFLFYFISVLLCCLTLWALVPIVLRLLMTRFYRCPRCGRICLKKKSTTLQRANFLHDGLAAVTWSCKHCGTFTTEDFNI